MVLQRVASNWKGTVEGSPDLQRELFLAPTRDRQIIAPVDTGAYLRYCRLRWACFDVLDTDFVFGEARDEFDFKVVLLNPHLSTPMIQKTDDSCRYLATFLQGCWHDGRMDYLLEAGREMPSCSDMFLTQPPVKSVICVLRIPPSANAADRPCTLCGHTLERPLMTPCCKRFYCQKHHHLIQNRCFVCRSPIDLVKDSFKAEFAVWEELKMIEIDEGVRVRDVLGALRSWFSRRGGIEEPPEGICFEFPGDRIDEGLRAPITALDQEDYEEVKDKASKQEEEKAEEEEEEEEIAATA